MAWTGFRFWSPDRRLLSAAFVLCIACHRWAPGEVTPAELEAGKVKSVRVTTREGRWVLDRPSMAADSLVGLAMGPAPAMDAGARMYTPRTEQRRAVAMRDITRVERRRVDVGATAFLAAGGAAATLLGAVIAACASGGCSP